MANVIARTACPKCSSSSDGRGRYISWDNGTSYCFVCQYRGGRVNMMDVEKEAKTIDPSILNLLQNPVFFNKESRGIPGKFYRELGIGYNVLYGQNYIIYPYGKLGYKLRGKDKKFKSEGDLYNGTYFLEHIHEKASNYTLVITEGEADAIAAYYALGLDKYRVTSLPSGSSSVKKFIQTFGEKLNQPKRIILAFDMDEPGEKARQEFLKYYNGGAEICIASYTEKDANDMVKVGKIKELYWAIVKATPKIPENIVNMSREELAKFLYQDPPLSWPIRGFPTFDRVSRGIRLSELSIYAGATDSGKSTLVVQIYGDIVDEFQVPLFYVDLETPLDRSYYRWVAYWSTKRYKANKHLGPDNPYIPLTFENLVSNPKLVTEEYYLKFYDEFGHNLIQYDSEGGNILKLDKLLQLMKYSEKIRRAQIIIIDNITATTSALAGEGGDRILIDNLMEQLAQFAKNERVHVVGIAHLSKPPGEEGFQEGRKIKVTDLRGSGNIGNRATNTIYIEGNMDEGSTRRTIVMGKTKIGRSRNIACDVYIRDDESEGGLLIPC